MTTRLYFVLFVLALSMPAAFCADVPVIQEGFLLEEAEGLLKLDKDTAIWQFIPEKAVELSDDKTFPAETPLPMLPCAVLEQMTKLAGDKSELRVQLWAIFTKYHDENYLFSVYFLPIAEKTDPTPPEPEPKQGKNANEKSADKDTSDSIIPENILKQIRSTETPDLKTFEQIAQVSGDVNMIRRTGYLQQKDGKRVFHPDGFGRNVNSLSLVLLPNQSRADAEAQTRMAPGRQRFTISGLITTYKGQQYMLLRKAERTYTNGNFTR